MTKRYKLHHNYHFGYGVEDTYNSDRLYLDEFECLVDEMNTLNDENEQLKELIHTMLKQIDAEKIGSKNAVYSARIIFTCEEFLLIKDIWGRR